ncbi:MAG: hypothetical protein GY809_11400, partial [Planctomycetes bacterium]|nr:hypothetical protein [Planctomycetota bacterium]
YDTQIPELAVETVKLQFVDAATASEAFSCLSSEIGRIVPMESGNALIVFDTPDNLKKIVTEIKKADRPIESVMLQYVSLIYIDANTAQSAMSSVLSLAGTIIPVTKTNGIILCDNRLNVEAMVKAIQKLDKPMAGIQVRPLRFDHIDASSAMAALTNMLSSHGTISIVERTNSIVVSDLPKNLEEISKEAKALDRKSPGLVVEMVNLKFLDAQNMATVLTKMLTRYGSVVSNDTTNTIILCDTQENVAKIVSEIQKVDQTPSQIMVEVVLLDVRLADDKEIGINWDVVSRNFRERTGGTYNTDGTTTVIPYDADTSVGPAMGFDASTASSLGGVVSVFSGSVHAFVTAVQSTRDVEVIASPSALVLSGKTARILAAEEVPYEELNSTSQGGSMVSTKFKEVGVTLEVTATLADDDQISLGVLIQQSVRTGESVGRVPVIDTRSEDTTLLLHDGQVVIMGGLRRREKTVQVTKVPLLGDLPLLGTLFRTKHDIVSNSELVVLLSPHIYEGEAVPESILDRVKELKEKAPITGAVSKQ